MNGNEGNLLIIHTVLGTLYLKTLKTSKRQTNVIQFSTTTCWYYSECRSLKHVSVSDLSSPNNQNRSDQTSELKGLCLEEDLWYFQGNVNDEPLMFLPLCWGDLITFQALSPHRTPRHKAVVIRAHYQGKPLWLRILCRLMEPRLLFGLY